MLKEKRRGLGNEYKTREKFIELRSTELFDNNDWISPRHLTNIKSGKNWVSIERLMILSAAPEENPVDLFDEIIHTYREGKGIFHCPTPLFFSSGRTIIRPYKHTYMEVVSCSTPAVINLLLAKSFWQRTIWA